MYMQMHMYMYIYIYNTLLCHMAPRDTITQPMWLHNAHVDPSGAIWHHRVHTGNHGPIRPNMAPYGQCGHMWAQHVPICHNMAHLNDLVDMTRIA